MALQLSPFAYHPAALRALRNLDGSWGPPDMSQQLQSGIAGIGQAFSKQYQQGRTNAIEDQQLKAREDMARLLETYGTTPGATPAAAGPAATGPVGAVGDPGLRRGHDVTPPDKIAEILNTTATKYGIDPVAFTKVAQIESSFNPNAINQGSKAAGLFQFIPGTAQQYGLTTPFDPSANADAAARLWIDNRDTLRTSLGREPTPGEMYLAHQQGVGAARDILRNPDKPVFDVAKRRNVISNLPASERGNAANMTAGQFAQLWTSKIDAPGTPVGIKATNVGNAIDVRPDPEIVARATLMSQAPGATADQKEWAALVLARDQQYRAKQAAAPQGPAQPAPPAGVGPAPVAGTPSPVAAGGDPNRAPLFAPPPGQPMQLPLDAAMATNPPPVGPPQAVPQAPVVPVAQAGPPPTPGPSSRVAGLNIDIIPPEAQQPAPLPPPRPSLVGQPPPVVPQEPPTPPTPPTQVVQAPPPRALPPPPPPAVTGGLPAAAPAASGLTPQAARLLAAGVRAGDPLAMRAAETAINLRQGEADFGFIQGKDGSVYRYNKRTGALELGERGTLAPKAPETIEQGGIRYQWNGSGWVPAIAPGQGGPAPMFAGNSVEAQSLNHLVQQGVLTPNQAAEIGAGKSVTGKDGTTYFVTPQGLVGQPAGGGAEAQPPAAATPGPPAGTPPAAAGPAAPPGARVVIPGGQGAQPLPAEVTARVTFATRFLNEQLPSIRETEQSDPSIFDFGKNRAAMLTGYGRPGEVYRWMQDGREAILRMATGAGMNKDEAVDYADRFLPRWRDRASEVKSKLANMERALKYMVNGLTTGRNLTADELRVLDKEMSPGGVPFKKVD